MFRKYVSITLLMAVSLFENVNPILSEDTKALQETNTVTWEKSDIEQGVISALDSTPTKDGNMLVCGCRTRGEYLNYAP